MATTTLRPAPTQTDNLRTDLMHVATVFQNRPDVITRAMTDPDTRKELTRLVYDLFELVEVIESEAK